MTHTTKAIELAIKGGYTKDGNEYPGSYSIEFICLDPEFWSSLGKSLGWKEEVCQNCGKVVFGRGPDTCYCEQGLQIDGYLYQWHRFIDALAEGKTPEQFFESLLVNEK